MDTTGSEASVALRRFIYSQAQQMSHQIARAAEEFGAQSAQARECGPHVKSVRETRQES